MKIFIWSSLITRESIFNIKFISKSTFYTTSPCTWPIPFSHSWGKQHNYTLYLIPGETDPWNNLYTHHPHNKQWFFSNFKTNHTKFLHTVMTLFLVATSTQSPLELGLIYVGIHTLFCLNLISLFLVAAFAQSPLVVAFIVIHTMFMITFCIESIIE